MIPLTFILIVIVVSIVYFSFKSPKKMEDINMSVSGEKIEVPVKATFGSYKFLYKISKWIGTSINNLNPLFSLFDDHIEYKVILKKESKLENIELVAISTAPLTTNITIFFNDTSSIFTANLMDSENRLKVLKFFEEKQVPLSAEAKNLLMSK